MGSFSFCQAGTEDVPPVPPVAQVIKLDKGVESLNVPLQQRPPFDPSICNRFAACSELLGWKVVGKLE